ncbi:MAG: DUF1501 domain-containing protein, partial [Pirellulaceae bacterium]|nr:DUF1501 domain-containing protein [Pirellulaceae bacterium]
RHQLDLLRDLNDLTTVRYPDDDRLRARIKAHELAFRMQMSVPKIVDFSAETQSTLDLYGMNEEATRGMGQQALAARRLVEQGVRFVQIYDGGGGGGGWDAHSKLKANHTRNCGRVDKPIAGLLIDLKQRGLLKDTLVMWSGEFGRTPTVQGSNGRDHNPEGFTVWMAGGGVKPGFRYGATDEYGYFAVENRMDVHDLHATLLHLVGLNHEELTYHYAGREFRLTDVSGDVHEEILA